MTTAEAYTVIDSCYGDPLLKRTDLGPFQKYPERSSWVEFEVREYPDGLTLRYERECGRWSSVGQTGTWMLAAERRAFKAEHELFELRKRVALFVETTENPGRAPFPPIKGAEGPGVWPDGWYDYLKREARKAERVTSCMYPKDCAEAHADFAAGKTEKLWVGACGFCRAEAEAKAAAK